MPGVVGVILAAGRATRFGSPKVLATLDGRPLLQHVVDRLRSAGVDELIVVLGADAAAAEDAVAWPPSTTRVVNPAPERGLASSLALGAGAALARTPPPDTLLVALGDQPRIDPAVIGALLATDPAHAVVVPRYPTGADPNPVLLRRAAFGLLDEVAGDRGLRPVLARHPELVFEVPVEGANPDVDTPADLVALADVAAPADRPALDGAPPSATAEPAVRHPVR
jgi:molybdenum cofactor cytidylyltransferase